MSDTDFTFVDAIPESGNPVDVGELTCRTCGTPLHYSGRGRKPQYCDEHKKSRTTTVSGGKSSGLVSRAIDELELLYGISGQGLKFLDPIAGEMVYGQRAELAESWRLLLETNKRVRELFAKIESTAAWLPILTVHGNLIAAIWFQHSVAKMTDQASAESDVS